MKRALISVSDKTGVVEFAKSLTELGYEIISTGGTAKALSENGVNVISVSDITGFPECLDGRVKTLHPKIHAGILAMRDNPEHMQQLKDLNVDTIDIVAINLYPFKNTIMKDGVTREEAIENIDIGGPTMLRAAAKNYGDVCVVVDPADYGYLIDSIKNGNVTKEFKLTLAYKVFNHTAKYDAMISNYLRKETKSDIFPDDLTVTFEKVQGMRYGENSHQSAAFYKEVSKDLSQTLVAAKQLWGKELSFNNINDAECAVQLVKEFDSPAAVAVKHANPCGVGTGKDIFSAYMNAYNSDPVSIFGGIVALNREVSKECAQKLSEIFLEIIIPPAFSKEALEILEQKKNIRLLELPDISKPLSSSMLDYKKVSGGLLVQEPNLALYDELKCVTKKSIKGDEEELLKFAMKVVKFTKSNAIVLADRDENGFFTVGIGPGQTNRVTALKIALEYAGDKAKGCVLASDAFFPFSDCVEAAAKAGVSAIIQPGGSIRDNDSIAACDENGIAMVFSSIRHFRH